MKKYNIALSLVFLAISVYGVIASYGMKAKLLNDNLGPGFWPRVLCVALGVLSVLLLVTSLLKKEGEEEAPIDVKSPGFKRVALLSGLLILFGALIYFFGIYIAMIIMMPLCMLLHGERKPIIIAAITIVMTVFIFLVFGKLLHVPLPTGLLFK